MTWRPWIRRALAFLLIAATFAFLGRAIYRDAAELRDFAWRVEPGLLALSVALLPPVFLWGVAVWRLVILRCGAQVRLRELARAWVLANLGRYIPGVVWQFVGLAQFASSVGLAPAAMITTLLVNMGFSLLAAGLVGAWLLPTGLSGPVGPLVTVLRVVSPLALALAHPAFIRFALRAVARVTRREELRWGGSWLDGLVLLAASAMMWFLYGGALHLFLLAFVPLPASAYAVVTAANALAFVVGYLVIIAPGGLGFREGAMTLLLAVLVPPGVAASLSIASRLWTVAGEVLAALVFARRRAPAGGAPAPADEPSES